jgi:hypothetical protein
MNKNETRVPARFGPETRFEVRPAPPAPFRATQETEFERLKNRLLARQLAGAPTPELNPPLRRAANEAAALAWATVYPLLVFPVLFEEKTQAALRQAFLKRQARIFVRAAANCSPYETVRASLEVGYVISWPTLILAPKSAAPTCQ